MSDSKEVPVLRRHPAIIILKVLLQGHPVPYKDEDWYFRDGIFGPERTMVNTETKAERTVVLGVDMTLGAFVTWCQALPEETVIQAVGQSILSQIGKKKRP